MKSKIKLKLDFDQFLTMEALNFDPKNPQVSEDEMKQRFSEIYKQDKQLK